MHVHCLLLPNPLEKTHQNRTLYVVSLDDVLNLVDSEITQIYKSLLQFSLLDLTYALRRGSSNLAVPSARDHRK